MFFYLVEKKTEVARDCGQPEIFGANGVFLEDEDVAVHRLVDRVLQRQVLVLDVARHVRHDLFVENQLKNSENVCRHFKVFLMRCIKMFLNDLKMFKSI
jgi:hypothetical protein